MDTEGVRLREAELHCVGKVVPLALGEEEGKVVGDTLVVGPGEVDRDALGLRDGDDERERVLGGETLGVREGVELVHALAETLEL